MTEHESDAQGATSQESSSGPGTPPPQYDYGYPHQRLEGKSTVVAAVLSMLPGAGHVYVGAYRRAFAHILIFALLITLLSNGDIVGFEPLFGLMLAFFFVYNIIDAARRAQNYNRALRAGAHLEEDPVTVDDGFGPGFGISLIAVGAMLLLHTAFDVDFRWLRDWWPLALILVGANIVRSSRQTN